MTAYMLDVAKLVATLNRVRRAGTPQEISYRQIARDIGVHPSMFTRLNAGLRPEADVLCSLLLWVDPEARMSDYVVPGPAQPRRRRPAPPRVARHRAAA